MIAEHGGFKGAVAGSARVQERQRCEWGERNLSALSPLHLLVRDADYLDRDRVEMVQVGRLGLF